MHNTSFLFRPAGLLLTASLLSSCVADMPEPEAFDEVTFAEDEPVTPEAQAAVEKAATCSNRWQPADRSRDVSYDSAGSRCSGGATNGALVLGDYVREHFGHLMNLSVDGRGVQIYNCRTVRGGQSLSLHSEGRAVDLFIPTLSGGNSNNTKGDVIANWLIENAERIGVQLIIWDRTVWNASRSPQERCYSGAHPHNDHIHVELTRAGASRQTAFFRDLSAGLDPAPNDPAPDNPAPSPVSDWISEPCRQDADCVFSSSGVRAACFRDHGPADGVGFCTLACQGFCPDKANHATTFCVSASDLGGRSGRGACVQQSASLNRQCAGLTGQTDLPLGRFVGTSGASQATREVCVPVELLDRPEPAPEPQPTPEPDPDPAGNGGICQDGDMPLGENSQSCAGFPAEHWRCACSATLSAPVSQVCRSGRWLNYQTNPRDCSSCSGSYSSACEPGPPPSTGNGGVCSDSSLPLSQNGASCVGFSENHWRCACDSRFEEATSEVCRSGRWVTYDTNPRDCSRCNGAYTSGCEGR